MAMAASQIYTNIPTFQYVMIQTRKAERIRQETFALLVLHFKQRNSSHGITTGREPEVTVVFSCPHPRIYVWILGAMQERGSSWGERLKWVCFYETRLEVSYEVW